ncbi:antibiotic biosynthesis monooxygenase [Blastococcus sp. URHD0036]|uniref:antibiotic biosynthesis monooxygenase n=1 Tax=Blastococcus sp. URHD0036 TaxID=1380356 RepID=UPI000498657C|nr:antibiotic biosynthesis monooxygenase [Blastococcus sp. URHD0036]
MYARSTTIRGLTGAIDAGIAYIREEALPAVREMPGCVGLSLLTDRDTGRSIATSAWRDEETMRASAELVHLMRERLVAAFGAELEVEEWEIAVLQRAHTMHDHGAARVTWLQVDDGQMDRLLDAYRSALMPRLQELPNFCSLSLLVDRAADRAVSTVTFHSRVALEAVRDRARVMRDELTGSVGARVLDVAETDVVLSHLRVPEMV